MMTSASTMTTGLRRPQSYGGARPLITSNTTTTNSSSKTDSASPLSPVYGTRLAQPTSPMEQQQQQQQQLVNSSSSIPSRISRPRRPSVIGTPSTTPVSNKSTLPQPRPTIRQRTMSDAGRLDMSNLPTRSSTLNNGHHRPRADLRRSLYLDQDDSIKSILSDLKSSNANEDDNDDDDSDDDENSKARRYRASAPLLNAYGVPTMKSRASMGALKYSSSSYTSTPPPPPPMLPPSDLNQKIRVCVRKRPLNRKEVEKGEKDISPCIGTRTLHINEPK